MKNLQQIKALVGIRQLPDILFLVQLDEYQNLYRTHPEFNMFPRKAGIVARLQQRLDELGLQHVVASFLGRDTMGVFLRLEGKTVRDPAARERVGTLARDLIEYVSLKTGESVSVGISEFCPNYARFPQAYAECKMALGQNFRTGMGSYSIYDGAAVEGPEADVFPMEPFFHALVAALDGGATEACRAEIRTLVDALGASTLSPVGVRLHMVELISRLSGYYAAGGTDRSALRQLTFDATRDMLSCNFLSNTEDILMALCGSLLAQLDSTPRDGDACFRQFVDDCVQKHYADCTFGPAVVAGLLHYSETHFSRLFKRVYGESFGRYLTLYRIERAKQLLLAGSLSLQDIAIEVGFRSNSYFSTVFKKEVGLTPRQYMAEQVGQSG